MCGIQAKTQIVFLCNISMAFGLMACEYWLRFHFENYNYALHNVKLAYRNLRIALVQYYNLFWHVLSNCVFSEKSRMVETLSTKYFWLYRTCIRRKATKKPDLLSTGLGERVWKELKKWYEHGQTKATDQNVEDSSHVTQRQCALWRTSLQEDYTAKFYTLSPVFVCWGQTMQIWTDNYPTVLRQDYWQTNCLYITTDN